MVRRHALTLGAAILLGLAAAPQPLPGATRPKGNRGAGDARTLRGRVMCGYQGWFRCPGDASQLGWIHWSRDPARFSPQTLTFEMWPDMREYSAKERYPAPGFTYPDGRPASLFSSDNRATVLRHFGWMRDFGIDGAWLQHFVVDLPGGPAQERHASRQRVLEHVRHAAQQTGRVWALSYDIAGMPADRVLDVLTADWRRLVDRGITRDARYLHDGGKPVVQIWGFYRGSATNRMTPELANRLIDFFKAPGPYQAYLVGGGDWDWRRNPDPTWQAFQRRFDAYTPWNVGNYSRNPAGVTYATTDYWAEDQRESERRGVQWIPVVYPGFSWDNLKQEPPGATTLARRRGAFYWEQFHTLAQLQSRSVYVAMFDEVDEGTAIFKVTSSPPTQAHFVDYEGLPSDWYLRLTREGARMLRGERPVTATIPIKP